VSTAYRGDVSQSVKLLNKGILETTKILLLLFSFSINFYIIVITSEIIESLRNNDVISEEKHNRLFWTTLLLPVLGYYLVRKIEITEEY